MKIVVSGASGLIGTQLVAKLSTSGHEVVRLVRRSPKAGEIQWNPKSGTLDASALEGVDAVIHLSGAGIGDKRWSNGYRKEILDSRTDTTALLAKTIASLSRKPSVFLSGSAIGIYGARNDEQLTEVSTHGTGFLAEVCEKWEAAAKPAVDAGVRTVYLSHGVFAHRNRAFSKRWSTQKIATALQVGRRWKIRQWQAMAKLDFYR